MYAVGVGWAAVRSWEGRDRWGKGRAGGLCKEPTPGCLPPTLRIYPGAAVPGLLNPQSQRVCVLAGRGWEPSRAPEVQGWARSLCWPGSSCCDTVIRETSAPFQSSSAPLPLPYLGITSTVNSSHTLRTSLGFETSLDIKKTMAWLWAVVSSPGEVAVKIVSAGYHFSEIFQFPRRKE